MRTVCSLLVVLAACKSRALHIELDGELNEPAWNARAERHVLLGDDGHEMRPYSELRALHDDAHVYLGLYAADEDIRSTDTFDVEIGGQTLHYTAGGPHVDRDGTLDQPNDFDEEWVVEAAVPRPSSPELSVTRCDTVKSGERRCGAWRGKIDLR